MDKQIKLDLDLVQKDDLFVIYSNRQVIRKAFAFWKEIDTLDSPSTKQIRSSSASDIHLSKSESNGNEEELDSIHSIKSSKSISYQNLNTLRKNTTSSNDKESNKNGSNKSKTIVNNEKHKKFKKFDSNPSKTNNKKRKKQKSLDIIKPPSEDGPVTPPRSVELKRKAFAIKKQVAISPHSPENPIKDMRGRLLGKVQRDEIQYTKSKLEIPSIVLTKEDSTISIFSPRSESSRSESLSTSHSADISEDLCTDDRKRRRKYKASSTELEVPKLLSISEPSTPENSDCDEYSPKVHRRKRLARRSSTGNEITHLGKRPISTRIEKREWDAYILETKPTYRKRSSTKFSRPSESKDGKNLIMKTLESFFRTRDEQLKNSRKEVFGIPLDACFPINSEAPIFIIEACNNIRASNLDETFNDVFELNSMTDKDMLVIRNSIEDQHIDIVEEKDTKIVANSLLIFFIDLSDSLCTSRLYDNFLYLADISQSSYRFRLTHSLIHSIPATNRLTLQYMANFIADLSNGDEDRLSKLTNFFAPSMFRNSLENSSSKSSTDKIKLQTHSSKSSNGISYMKALEESSKSNKASTVLKYIVNNRKKLFKLTFKNKRFVLLRGKLVLESSTFPEMINVLLDEFYSDSDYADIFFLNYQQFTSSLELLRTLLDIYNKCSENLEYCKRRRIKILMTLKIWFKSYGNMLYKDETFLALVYEYTFEKTHLTKEEEILWSDLYSTLNISTTIGIGKIKVNTPHLAEIIFKSKITDYKPSKVAKAITQLDLENFKAINSFECLNKAFCDPEKGKNFFKMASQFNRINLWVQTLIVERSTVKERVYLINFFSQVLEHLLEFNNFNGALAIYSALTSTSISRLTKSWSKVSRKVLRLLEVTGELFSFNRNYKNYYLKLKECILPVIPQIAVISRNLFAIEENMESIVNNNLINIEKMRSIYSIIVDIKKYQKSNYSFNKNSSLISYLKKIEPRTEEEILDISENLEKKQPK